MKECLSWLYKKMFTLCVLSSAFFFLQLQLLRQRYINKKRELSWCMPRMSFFLKPCFSSGTFWIQNAYLQVNFKKRKKNDLQRNIFNHAVHVLNVYRNIACFQRGGGGCNVWIRKNAKPYIAWRSCWHAWLWQLLSSSDWCCRCFELKITGLCLHRATDDRRL